MQFLQPPGRPRPKSHACGVAASGRQVYVSGMVGWDSGGVVHSDDFVAQSRQALENIVAVLNQAGARRHHLVRMTWHVLDKREYLAAGAAPGDVCRAVIGRHYPAMSALQVAGLMEQRARVEIEVSAVIPE